MPARLMDPSQQTLVMVALVGLVFATALAGGTGYALLVSWRQRRLSAHLERLASADGPELDALAGVRRGDARMQASLDRLTDRLRATWARATIDQLTGVPNRQALLGRLDEELRRAARYQRPLSVALVDLDHFKRLNDSFGHAAGDRVLATVAGVLRDSIRSTDAVGRIGGEEFMVVLPETDADSAASMAEKLRRLVSVTMIDLGESGQISVTLSAGVAGGLGGHLDLDTLVRDADAALYSAKALGRDQVYVFNEVEDDGPIRRAPIDPAARAAAVEVGRAALDAATETLTLSLSERPGWAGRPSTMIAEAAMAVARSLGLPEREIDRIRVASLLHDLGKLAIPNEILAKPEQLGEGEWRIVAEHPKIGQVVLEQAGALRDAATIVLHHHEWFDGRGYPHGLKGEEIPVGARIVAIADAYEAMVAGRPYRAAVRHEAALAELRRHAGRQFDPDLVEEFVHLFASGMPWALETDAEPTGPAATADPATDHGLLHDRLHAERRRPADRSSSRRSGRRTADASG